MRINYITRANESLASYRYRIAIPARVLTDMGHEVVISGYLASGCDTVVFSKHFQYSDRELAKTCKTMGQKVVFDVCDNHFETEHGDYYRDMIGLADIVTVSTTEMGKIVKEEMGVDSVVISDPYEFDEVEPAEALDSKASENLLWFGHPSNIDSLNSVLSDLRGHNLMVVSKSSLGREVLEWSHEAMVQAFKSTDITVIPSLDNARKNVKSPNRMVESIRQGNFVIANHLPSYEQFGDWMYLGNMKDGLNWYHNNKDKVIENIKQAQKYVRDNFSPERIALEWEEVLEEVCEREGVQCL